MYWKVAEVINKIKRNPYTTSCNVNKINNNYLMLGAVFITL